MVAADKENRSDDTVGGKLFFYLLYMLRYATGNGLVLRLSLQRNRRKPTHKTDEAGSGIT